MDNIHYLPVKMPAYNDKIEEIFCDIRENKVVHQITFQVTEDCCMACTYCYQHNKSKNKMTFETAKQFIDDLLTDKYENINTSKTFTVIFDFIGGEPLMEIKLIE